MLGDFGASVIDADAISKEVTGVNGVALTEIASAFGSGLVSAAGILDRNKLRSLVFQDPSAKMRLEAILHPLIRQKMLANAVLATSQNSPCIVFDIPLLVESDTWRKVMDWIIVVDCSIDTQHARVMERNGLSSDMIQRVIASQSNRLVRLRAADIVLHNDAISLVQLAQSVRAFASKIGL